MWLIKLKDVAKQYGHENIFHNIKLIVNQWDKLAIVWNNWTWKSTLLNIIWKKDSLSSWELTYQKDLKVSHLWQDSVWDQDISILDYLFYNLEEDNFKILHKYFKSTIWIKIDDFDLVIDKMNDNDLWIEEIRIKKILSKLNILSLSPSIKTLSWGEIKRISLARLLIQDFDVLLLDEPTNHLDIEMTEWLEEYLKTVRTFVMITHDRYFLDRVCNLISEVDNKTLFLYKWSYSYYLEKKAEREQIAIKWVENAKTLYRKELKWIQKQPKARETKSRSRVDAFDDIKQKAFTNLYKDKIEINSFENRLWSKVVEIHNVSKSYNDKKIIDRFTYKFTKWQTIWLIWKNWVWKSTLINIITWKLLPDSWKVNIWDTVTIAHYKQNFVNFDNPSKTVIEMVRDITNEVSIHQWRKVTVSRFLKMFNFNHKVQNEEISLLSLWQKKRLYLVTLLLKNPNFLILDEPTNDLDIFTLTEIEDFLSNFNWCLLIVSHDRFFLDKLADHLLIMEGEWKLTLYSWTYSKYKANQLKIAKLESNKNGEWTGKCLSKKWKNRIKKIENKIWELEKTRDKLNVQIIENVENAWKIHELSLEFGEIEKEINDLEMEWYEINE